MDVASCEYFCKVFNHLCEYSWIYDFNNTKIFSDAILDNIPAEWQEALVNVTTEELSNIPYGFTKSEWPNSLIDYIQNTLALSVLRHQCLEDMPNSNTIHIPDSIRRGMSPKKVMEVKYLSALVTKLCRESDCSTVLDIGCGLGYLDQVLHYNFGYRIIGVDSESKKCQSAIKRTKNRCKQNIHYYTMKINENSCAELQNLLNTIPPYSPCSCGRNIKHNTEGGILMLSLHSCGDLSPNMLKIYVEMPSITGIVNVGCCYHIMEKDKANTHFTNFPLSQKVRSTYEDGTRYGTWKVSPYGLRLAAQESKEHWKYQSTEQHEDHSKYVAYRAMLQVYIDRNRVEWKKPRRHLARKGHIASFNEYIKSALSEFSNNQMALEQLHDIYKEFFPKIKTVEILTLLQVLLQPLWEIVIVYDRCLFLQESGIDARVVTVVDESVSPRNLAIIAIK